MEYLLIQDSCDTCRYTVNAFTLLRLPLKTLAMDDFHPNSAANAAAVLICPDLEMQNKKHIQQTLQTCDTSLISFTASLSHLETPVHHLKMPFSHHEIKDILFQCLNYKKNLPNHKNLNHPIFEKLVGQSPQIQKIKEMVQQVAYSDTTVLILGQSGTGKDVVASCIHYLSNRKDHPFVPINCGAIPGELMESELFGHEKGAFTGALTRRPGRFEIADGGTLFLDEIGDMPLPMQVKLLRVIQDRHIGRIGGNALINVDVRLIAATNKNLEDLIEHHEFREDLFYRLNVFPIRIPSLQERPEDILPLIEYNLDKIYERLKHRVEFSEPAKNLLREYPWPGNIRELQNFLERMVILHPDEVVNEKDIDLVDRQKKNHPPLSIEKPFNIKEYIAKIEQQAIEAALHKTDGIINAAAEYLSLTRTSLVEKMKKYRLSEW